MDVRKLFYSSLASALIVGVAIGLVSGGVFMYTLHASPGLETETEFTLKGVASFGFIVGSMMGGLMAITTLGRQFLTGKSPDFKQDSL